jgi:hypothetical protein
MNIFKNRKYPLKRVGASTPHTTPLSCKILMQLTLKRGKGESRLVSFALARARAGMLHAL